MDDAEREQIQSRLTDLKTKLSARQGRPGYSDNVKAIQAEIDRLTQLLAESATPPEDGPTNP